MGKLKFEDGDLKILNEMAKKYNMTLSAFCKAINNLALAVFQIRVSENEHKLIKDKASKKGLTIKSYCNFAVDEFFKTDKIFDVSYENFLKSKEEKRDKTIKVELSGDLLDTLNEFLKITSLEKAQVIIYCALNLEE